MERPAAKKAKIPATDVSQQIEAHLNKLDKYTDNQLKKIVHVFIYSRSKDMGLKEYIDMYNTDREIYIIQDSFNAVLF